MPNPDYPMLGVEVDPIVFDCFVNRPRQRVMTSVKAELVRLDDGRLLLQVPDDLGRDLFVTVEAEVALDVLAKVYRGLAR